MSSTGLQRSGSSNERLSSDEGGYRTYYATEAGSVISEYSESDSSTTPAWSKSYVYLGNRLLSTLTPNGSGGEAVQFHHPDRLGTRLVTNPADGSFFEQQTLPFGTALAPTDSQGIQQSDRPSSRSRQRKTRRRSRTGGSAQGASQKPHRARQPARKQGARGCRRTNVPSFSIHSASKVSATVTA